VADSLVVACAAAVAYRAVARSDVARIGVTHSIVVYYGCAHADLLIVRPLHCAD
jgi:hypothetical protein